METTEEEIIEASKVAPKPYQYLAATTPRKKYVSARSILRPMWEEGEQKAYRQPRELVTTLADQVYEYDMIPRLINRIENDGCDVISAMVPTRGHVARMNMRPFQPMAWRFKESTKFREYRGFELDGDMIDVIDN